MTPMRLSSIASGRRAPRVALFSGNYNYTLDGANKTLNRLVGHLQAQPGGQARIYSPTSPQPAFPPTKSRIMRGQAPNAGTTSSTGAGMNMPASGRARMAASTSTARVMRPRPRSVPKPG